MFKLTEVQRAYAAGIVDGEGCLTMCRSKDIRGRETYRPVLMVETTSLSLQTWLVSTFGKGWCARKRQFGNHKDRYLWCLSKKADLKEICLLIEPYVVIKRKHVEVMLDYLGKPYLHSGGRRAPIQNHLEEYRAYREIFAGLNFRGVKEKDRVNSGKPHMGGNPEPSRVETRKVQRLLEDGTPSLITSMSALPVRDDIVQAG